ncbi:leucine-rich repeat domain-containing protein [Psychrobacter sp. JCM 18903]|uniref:leucine-rich repeat domain-containing protein n=3 Tax=Psychrobacter sp. JCM 18903 TaxID=1298610 RepID=UPI001919035D|nr:leucine-rich repeat domain-containing protein [Psychrobacter sp. JCM 18903]
MGNVTNLDDEKWMKQIWNWADKAYIDESIIPRELKKLLELKEINISHNDDIKNIPESIGNLKNLERFILVGTNVKKLPNSIGHLVNLKFLYISYVEKLTDFPESIGNLKNLEHLSLDGSNFKKLPDCIGQLSNLKKLILDDNVKLTEITESIGNLKNLEEFVLEGNKVKELPDGIGYLESLENLKIENTSIKKLPDSIGQLLKLKKLDICDNSKLTEIPESIGSLNNLENLDLGGNSLKKIPDSIGQLSNLKELSISSNKLTSLPESIGDLKNLKILELYSNKLKSLPESIIGMENLESIEISDNPLKNMSKPILDFLQNLGVYSDEVDESDSSTSSVSNENDTSTFLQVNGYGVETFAGTVEAATYQYFEDNDIDLEDYSNDAEWGDDNCQVPEEHNFGGGGLYEVDNLWHVNGAYLTEDTQIELVNGSEDTIWSSNCDTESLESQGIKLICVSSQEDIFDSLDLKTVVMIGRIFQQGCTFENQLQDIENFDPNNLTIYYHEDESGRIIKKIEYNDTELENGNSSTSGSGSEYSWEVIG